MAVETTNISIRMDKVLKEQAESILSEMGINMTTAFNIFLRQTVRDRAIPFQISVATPNRRSTLADGYELVKTIQDDSIMNNTDKITMEEIDAEISAYRLEKRATQ